MEGYILQWMDTAKVKGYQAGLPTNKILASEGDSFNCLD